MKLIISDRALKHLDRIHAYLAERNANAADAEITAILDLSTCSNIASGISPKWGEWDDAKGARISTTTLSDRLPRER